jgi:hypothetical protein
MYFTSQSRPPLLLLVSICVLHLPLGVKAVYNDVSVDFPNCASAFPNPNGVWSYGYMTNALYPASSAVGQSYSPYTLQLFSGQCQTRNSSQDVVFALFTSPGQVPAVSKNLGPNSMNATAVGGVAMNPGPNNERAIIRYTSPFDASVSFSVHFFLGDYGVTDAQVSIRTPSDTMQIIWATSSTDSNPSTTGTFFLTTGGTLDFIVGYGTGPNLGDTTPVNITISAVGPSAAPTFAPSHSPGRSPTLRPVFSPTSRPTSMPTFLPTSIPTSPPIIPAQSWDVAVDFPTCSAMSNPNGPWSYGYIPALQYQFSAAAVGLQYYTDFFVLLPGKCEQYNSNELVIFGIFENGNQFPWVSKNFGPNAQDQNPVGSVALYPGDHNERPMVRWTAYCETNVTIFAKFFQGDSGVTDAQVAVGLGNGTSQVVFSTLSTDSDPSFSGNFSLTSGSSIDFIVGYGTGVGLNGFDTTPVQIEIYERPGCLTASPTIDPAILAARAQQAHVIFLVSVIVPVVGISLIAVCVLLAFLIRRRRIYTKMAAEEESKRPKFYPGIYVPFALDKATCNTPDSTLLEQMIKAVVLPPPTLQQLFQEKKSVASGERGMSDTFGKDDHKLALVAVSDSENNEGPEQRQAEWESEMIRQRTIVANLREKARAEDEERKRVAEIEAHRSETARLQEIQKARWLERRTQLALFYKMNQPESGPNFDDFVGEMLAAYSWADVVLSITRRHAGTPMPAQWQLDVYSGFEAGIEPPYIRDVIRIKAHAQLEKNLQVGAANQDILRKEQELLSQVEAERQKQAEREKNMAMAKMGYGVLKFAASQAGVPLP